MTPRPRLALFVVALAAAAPMLAAGLADLPAFGQAPGRYVEIANAAAVAERHIANAVTAVVFDLRGFDTLGEEFILFTAVTGVCLLLRERRGHSPGAVPAAAADPVHRRRSDAITFAGRVVAAVTVLFGLYVAAHGHISPGGGFQAGVIIGTALLGIYLTEGYRPYRQLSHALRLDAAEAVGVGAFVAFGLASAAAGMPFLANLLPHGSLGALLSGGQVPLLNLAVAVAVAAGFALLFVEFLEETRHPGPGEEE